MKNDVFAYEYIEPKQTQDGIIKRAVITKWFNCVGNIEIPTTLDDGAVVFGICARAFRLTDETESILIPREVKWIEEGAFDLGEVSLGYCPVLILTDSYHLDLDKIIGRDWVVSHRDWGRVELAANRFMTHKNADSLWFHYRLIGPAEIEITKWISPTDQVTIPAQIDGGLKVVSIGKNAFSEMPTLEKVVVPDTVKTVESCAFFYLNYAKYIYGDLMDPGWSISGTSCEECEIVLPGGVKQLSADAFLRGTEYSSRRHREDSYTNMAIITTQDNSETLNLLLQAGWIVADKQNGSVRLLIDENADKPKPWLNSHLMINPLRIHNREL